MRIPTTRIERGLASAAMLGFAMLFVLTIAGPLQQGATATELQPIIRAQPTPRLPLDIGAPGSVAQAPSLMFTL